MTSPILTTTAADIISAALRLIGEKDANQPLESVQFRDGLESFNFMVKSWQSQGLHLWTKTEGILFLDVGKTDYLLGPAGDEATDDDDFIDTALSSNEAITSTVLAVASTTGMLAGDNIGIELDNATRHWTTIVSVDSAVQLTITAGLAAAAESGNTVFTFTKLIDRPLRLLQLRRFTFGQADEIEASQWSREEYFAQPDKTSQGDINNWYYSPQLSEGRVYLWQTARNVDQVAKFTYIRPIQILLTNAESPDFPAEWFDALVFSLAARIGPEYSIPQDRLTLIRVDAANMLEQALDYDSEPASIKIQPNFGGA